ncbi:MAG: caspase family protein [Labilithrix sp.]|nr:caspase family protein [Labilithrix sp.]
MTTRPLRRLAAALTAVGLACAPAEALAEPVRILVSAGSKLGLPAERPLKFADNDARRVRDVMVSLGGVRSEHAFFLNEPNRGALFAAIERAKTVAQHHRAEEVTLVFYFSGHGDRDALHLGSDRVLVSELSAKLAEVPAGLRIAVTDACRATRDKGFTADEPFTISATMIPQASGQVWLHASSDGEAAQESDELQGALFTHAWLSGLRGAADTNGDARVTLDESFAFAHSQTLIRSAKSSGVMQKPEAVMTLREAAPVVLTQTSAHVASVTLPRARDTHFLVYSAAGKSVLSELWGSPDRALTLRVPPGRYVVHRRAGAAGSVAQIAIAAGESRRLEERDFTAASLETVARKGDDPDRAEPTTTAPRATQHEISAGYDTGVNARTGFVHGPRATYAHAWRWLALTVGGGAELTGRSLSDKDESLVGGYARAGLELRLPIGPLTLRAGAGGRAGLVVQTITATGAAAISGAASETKNAFAFGPEVVVAGRLPLSRAWFADLSATGGVSFLREEGALTGIAGAGGALALGARF